MSSAEAHRPSHDSIRGYAVAGGRSSRMRRDKARLPYRGATLLDHAIGTLRAVTDDVCILCGPTRRYEDFGVEVVADEICGAGPIGGLYAALTNAEASRCGRIVWLAVDVPNVPSSLMASLISALDDFDVAIPRTPHGLEPLCAAFRVRPCLDAIREALLAGRLKLTEALDGLLIRELPQDAALFANVNTPDEFEQLG